MTETAGGASRRLNLASSLLFGVWGSSQRLEVLVELDYDKALDVLATHYSVGRVHCQFAERKVEA